MDINGYVYIWVTDADTTANGVVLSGLAFDGEYGFGEEEVREYSGTLAVHSDEQRSVISANLSTMHISGKGVVWNINTNELPNAPFLLTSNLALVGPLINRVALNPTEEAIEIFHRDHEASYPVSSTRVIGILNHTDKQDVLIGFTGDGESLTGSIILQFSEWGIEAGTVTVE